MPESQTQKLFPNFCPGSFDAEDLPRFGRPDKANEDKLKTFVGEDVPYIGRLDKDDESKLK